MVSVVNTGKVGAVYNLEVADFNTYFVGEERLWVHNCGGLGSYSKVGGHHIFAKSAFEGVPEYSKGKALSASLEVLESYGVAHGDITTLQCTLFKEFADSGKANSLTAHARIAYESLVGAGIPEDVAKAWVGTSRAQLKQWGVAAPSRIPWAD